MACLRFEHSNSRSPWQAFSKKEVSKLDQYSIADFIEALATDDLEKKMIKLISESYVDENLLTRILEVIGRKKNDNL
jgi:hypothetical protein